MGSKNRKIFELEIRSGENEKKILARKDLKKKFKARSRKILHLKNLTKKILGKNLKLGKNSRNVRQTMEL